MRTKKGIITSAKMTGTVAVTVHRHAIHSKYRKRYRVSKTYLVDVGDHKNLIEGDEVLIEECKPISKNKYFKVLEIIKKSKNVSEIREEKDLESAMHRVVNTEDKKIAKSDEKKTDKKDEKIGDEKANDSQDNEENEKSQSKSS